MRLCLALGRALLLASPHGQAVHGCIPNDAVLLPLISLLGPFCSLPLGQGGYLIGGQSQGVKGSEESAVPLPPAEAGAVDPVVVVEAWVLGFGGVEVAIEGVDFLPNLEDQVSLQQGVKVLWVLRAWFRKHVLVDEQVDAAPLHVEDLWASA